ncbi:phosphoglycolate phosphatase [Lacisediminimonas sp.]|uniref:phosphoglycolate phosphatase n=1 Tax=Lacisediminimonas sp. TaxID=3060582 RepID=UPI00271810FD|nr:phosphoglycolate phosphatase [Lacisediminimonas sp.]MDO8298776.1 phosphoglycolate phosphatase [Lacisediminimonas sp.]MDO9217021.1 phosphoglycolate phosphatase [Lacisediminimonas sp.]
MSLKASPELAAIRGVAIDLDGTMIDTAPDFHIAINRMRAEIDLAPISKHLVIRYVGKGTDNLVRSILALELPADKLETIFPQALSRYHHHYHAINGDHSQVYPGVESGLAAMRGQGLRLACVTNKPIAFARPLLEKTGLLSFFEVVYGGDSLPLKKPDPYPMQQVCRDFSLAPNELLAIGDSSNDALAARAAGCKVVVVPYGYNHGLPVQTIDADGIVETLYQAAGLLARQALQ